MMDLNEIWPFELTAGRSKSPRQGACLMDAISWFEYGMLGDYPECVSSVLVPLGQAVNDFSDDRRRQELKRFIPRLVGTADPVLDVLRADYIRFAWVQLEARWERVFEANNHSSPMSMPMSLADFGKSNPPFPKPDLTKRGKDLSFAIVHALTRARCVGSHYARLEASPYGVMPYGVFWQGPAAMMSLDPVGSRLHRSDFGTESVQWLVGVLDVCCAIGGGVPAWRPDSDRIEEFARQREAA